MGPAVKPRDDNWRAIEVVVISILTLSSHGLTVGPSKLHIRGMSRDHNYYVYMLASKIGGTLYIGVTNDLARRVSEHRLGEASKFTRKYDVFTLVWYEPHTDINEAIKREKRLKNWKRKWKIALIEERNPHWLDLFPSLTGTESTGPRGQAAE